MPDGAPRLPRQGDVIWATVTDQNGVNAKHRPLVVISRTIDIRSDEAFFVVAITSTFPDPLEPAMVLLPWSPTRCATGLTRRCVAHCDWVLKLFVENVEVISGHVPPQVLAEILTRIPTENSRGPDAAVG
jgi:mRNA-degrading endonuclease toxin of MazEF toxin-antitoxin module